MRGSRERAHVWEGADVLRASFQITNHLGWKKHGFHNLISKFGRISHLLELPSGTFLGRKEEGFLVIHSLLIERKFSKMRDPSVEFVGSLEIREDHLWRKLV